jgi:hypothetical protein
MKKIFLIIGLIISQFSFAQLTQKDIGKLEIEDGTIQLDELSQKLEGDTFITTKHKRYIVIVFEFAIESQKIYDTINGTIPDNTEIKYTSYQNENNNLRKMSYYDFDGNLKKETVFNYDEDNRLSSKIEYDENGEEEGEETVDVYYYYDNCKPVYINDLLDDSNVKNTNKIFNCETITTVKKISNYTTSIVNVYKTGFGKIKKIALKGDKDTAISRFYTYERDDDGNLLNEDLTIGEKVRRYKTYTYNDKGDLKHIKSGYVELFYTYKYDKNGKWIEKIETSKVKNKRTVYKRSFN